MRECAIQNRLNGTDQDAATLQLQIDKKYPSTSTIDRWMARRHVYGHVRALQRTGNHRALREVSGDTLIFLRMYRAELSKATGC